jgi:DNA-binding LacI/PurR family transcriptional regulator
MGQRAAELLIERIGAKRRVAPQRILIPPRLVERESTRGAKECPNFGRKKS